MTKERFKEIIRDDESLNSIHVLLENANDFIKEFECDNHIAGIMSCVKGNDDWGKYDYMVKMRDSMIEFKKDRLRAYGVSNEAYEELRNSGLV